MPRSIRRYRPVFVLLLSLATASCTGSEPATAAATPSPEPRVDISAVRVGLADIESALHISGSLVPRTRVGVAVKWPGTLSTVAVEIGDRVRAGQTLATLDRREVDAQVDAAVAAVAVAKASIDAADAASANARLELTRAENLFEKGAIPRQRLDGASTAHRAAAAQSDLARANMAQAEAALRRAREVQRDGTLLSPIDGVVVERRYDPGARVAPGDPPLVVVADLREMKLEAGVSELEAGRLRVGMMARVHAQAHADRILEGRVAAIAPEVDARNRHFRIEVRTPNREGALLSGMYGEATIPLVRLTQVIAVPVEAVVTRDTQRIALKVEGDAVRPVPVSEGLSDGVHVQILSGLVSGDIVVADARRGPPTGTKVNPIVPR